MRKQDELLAIYDGQSPMGRKYLLGLAEPLAREFDADELLTLFQSALADPMAQVRAQGVSSLAHFLPGHVRRRYALATPDGGYWTNYSGTDLPVLSHEGIAELTRSSRQVGQAASFVLRPLALAILELTSEARGLDRTRAILSLGHLGLKECQDWLVARATDPHADLEVGEALCELGTDEAHAAVVGAVRAHGAHRPDLFLWLRGAPGSDVVSILEGAATRTTAVGRMNLARALADLHPLEAAAGFSRLTGRGEGWVDAAALASLEELASPAGLPAVVRTFHRTPHAFVKAQAVRAAGAMRDDRALAFCLDALEDPVAGVRAVALESLVRLRAPRDTLRAAALPMLESPHLRARTHAILATLAPGEVIGARPFRELLLSADPLSRVEAAYCLGYLRTPHALAMLATLAALDPCASVRTQSIKSLSRYPAAESVTELVPLVGAPDRRVAEAAARALARYDGPEAGLVADGIGEALEGSRAPRTRALYLRVLGSAVARSGQERSLALLIAGLFEKDTTCLAGAVEGWVQVSARDDGALLERLREIGQGPEPHLAARAQLALWHSGVESGIAQLARRIGSRTDGVCQPALECALEIGLLRHELWSGCRFPALTALLRAQADSPGFDRFVGAQGVLLGGPRRRAPAFSIEPEAERTRPATSGPMRPPEDAPPSRGSEDPPTALPAGPTATPPIPEGVSVDKLRAFLTAGAVAGRAGQEARRLKEDSCLAPGSNVVSRGMELFSAHPRALAAAVLAVLFVALTWLSGAGRRERSTPPPLPAGARSHLWVEGLSGGGTGLSIHQAVRAGQPIRSVAGSTVVLATPWRARVTLRGDARLVCEAIGTAHDGKALYVFSGPAGDVLFAFDDGPALEVRAGELRVTTSRARLQNGPQPGSRRLAVERGSARLLGPAGNGRLEAGDSVDPR